MFSLEKIEKLLEKTLNIYIIYMYIKLHKN